MQFCYLQCSLAFLDKCILCTPWLIYRSTYRPMYWSTYQPSVNWYIGRHVGWHSADISTKICRSTYQLMYQPRYQPSEGRHINWLSADFMVDIAADTLPTRWPLIVGGVSVDCRWYISGLSYNISQKLRLSEVTNLVQVKLCLRRKLQSPIRRKFIR